MASDFGKTNQYVGDDLQQKDLPLSAEDKHHDLLNKRDDRTTSAKSDVYDITKKLIVNESKHNVAPSSESVIQSSCPMSIAISIEDNQEDDGNRKSIEDNQEDDGNRKSTESSDSELIIVNEDHAGLSMDSYTQTKEDNADVMCELPAIMKYDPTIDERLPETVTLLTTPDGGKLYLIGTAHFSIESQNDVSKIIQAVQPQIIVVELCKARIGLLQLDEEVMLRYAKDISIQCIMDTIKEEGLYNGLLQILLLRMAAHVAKELGMPPGGEFRRAFEEAKKIPNCIIHMADRPINITIQRAIRALSWWQTIKLGWHLMVTRMPITQEDIEFCKQRWMLDEMIASMKGEFPVLGEVFVKERDIYLTYSLQLACMPQHRYQQPVEPVRVVGIVGLGHTPGIIENWGKVKHSDIPPIMVVPPPSLSSKILKLTTKATMVGAVFYIGYKILVIPTTITYHSIKSSVQGLLKISNPL